MNHWAYISGAQEEKWRPIQACVDLEAGSGGSSYPMISVFSERK